jgi:peptidoglycan/xylan/chitin deacetylase (PgdA/CDA1 family)
MKKTSLFGPILGLAVLVLVIYGVARTVKGDQTTIIWAGNPLKHEIALTFDDGPSPRFTPEILKLLNKYHAHGTFFVMGQKVEKYPYLIKYMLREGHEVGNHSFSHPRLTKSDRLARQQEIERTGLDLELLGCPRRHRLLRPPYSAFDQGLVNYAAHTDRQLALWNIDSGDWKGLKAQVIAHNVLSRVRNGSIIIFHDDNETSRAARRPTVEALKIILPALKALGYHMVTVSELMAPPTH